VVLSHGTGVRIPVPLPSFARPERERASDGKPTSLADSDILIRRPLTYDIQVFVLGPGEAPIYFVRAVWLAGRRQAFVAAVWLRSETFEIVEANTVASAWLRTFEFQGSIEREQLGLVLNVIDRDHDGWGEIIFAQGGYESLAIELREYTATGFAPAGASFVAGC
jgi:hypothetical protein